MTRVCHCTMAGEACKYCYNSLPVFTPPPTTIGYKEYTSRTSSGFIYPTFPDELIDECEEETTEIDITI